MYRYSVPYQLKIIRFGPGSKTVRHGMCLTTISEWKYPHCYVRPKVEPEIVKSQILQSFRELYDKRYKRQYSQMLVVSWKKKQLKKNTTVRWNRTECSIFSLQYKQAWTGYDVSTEGKVKIVTRTLRARIIKYTKYRTTYSSVKGRRSPMKLVPHE